MKVKDDICYDEWPEDWTPKAFTSFVNTQVSVALLLMVTLYSRVVYTLWIKRNDVNQVTVQQKVRKECPLNEIYLVYTHSVILVFQTI